MVSEVLCLGTDEHAVCGSQLVRKGCTLGENGIGDGLNVQVLRRVRGGASLYLDVPGQWECKVFHATRCWPTRKRCYKCNAPRDTVPNNPVGLFGGHLLRREVLVLPLGALGQDTILRETREMGMSPLQGLVLAPVLPGQK